MASVRDHALASRIPRSVDSAAVRTSGERESRFVEATMPHADVLYNVALRMVGDPCLAEDVVQETYLAAFRSFDGYRGGSIRSWLVAICLNTARTHHRRRRARPSERYDIDLTDAASHHDTCELALEAIEHERVRTAIEALPEVQRVCVILCDLAGLTAQEAADAIGCPRGTVLARVHRARRRLAVALVAEHCS